MRLFILFLILGILILVVVVSSLQLAWHYFKTTEKDVSAPLSDMYDSKEQIITDLSDENSRLTSEIDELKRQLSSKEDQE